MAKPQFIPTVDQVRQLPLQLQIQVPPQWEDRNGHVNVQHYLNLFSLASWNLLDEVGIDEAWYERSGISLFDLEHHLHYLSELRAGDSVSCYERVVDCGEKLFQGVFFVVNDTRNCLAATVEYLTACIDMKTRRIVPSPADLSTGMAEVLSRHRALTWPPPLCGSMSV